MGRKAENLIGKKFNYLTPLRRATEEEYPRGAGKHAMWLCKCDCGQTRFVSSSDLKSGRAVSCGCKNKEKAKELAYNLGKKNLKDLTGEKFGKLTVLKQGPYYNKQVQWICKCDCGTITTVRSSYLLNGHTTSCGCKRSWGAGKISKGEEKIINILKNAKIHFEREKMFPTMKKNGHNLRMDFYLPEQNIGIEFNGQGHYEQNKFFHKNRQEFNKRQEYDRYKIGYCLAHGIPIYCIPYWELENITKAADLFKEKYRAKDIWKNDKDFLNFQKSKI